MKIEVRTSLEALRQAAMFAGYRNGAGTCSLSRKMLGDLIADHHRMTTRLQDIGDEVECRADRAPVKPAPSKPVPAERIRERVRA